MHRLALVLFVVGAAAACSKKGSDSGLPPASDWNANPGTGSAGSGDGLLTMPGAASPHTGARNPHEGLGIPPPPGSLAGGDGDGTSDGTADGSQLPADHPMVVPKGPAKTLAKNADGTLALGPFALKVPDGWTEVPTTSEMRSAEFTFGDADLIVYYFGKDGAGSIEENMNRWAGQFTEQEGKPKIDKVKVAGQDATTIALAGHYVAMAMPGGAGATDKANQSMLGMIIASPNGPYYFKLVGSKSTLEANAAKWKAMLDTLKLKS